MVHASIFFERRSSSVTGLFYGHVPCVILSAAFLTSDVDTVLNSQRLLFWAASVAGGKLRARIGTYKLACEGGCQ